MIKIISSEEKHPKHGTSICFVKVDSLKDEYYYQRIYNYSSDIQIQFCSGSTTKIVKND